jgi:hypothetical protein
MSSRSWKHEVVCGIPTTVIVLGIGIASLVISIQDREENEEPNCGQGGSPPLRDYLFGTGISYLVIALSFFISSGRKGREFPLFSFILGFSNIFLFCWVIVGCVSLWGNGRDCEENNPRVFKMGIAAVIASIFASCCGGYHTYSQATSNPQNDEEV